MDRGIVLKLLLAACGVAALLANCQMNARMLGAQTELRIFATNATEGRLGPGAGYVYIVVLNEPRKPAPDSTVTITVAPHSEILSVANIQGLLSCQRLSSRQQRCRLRPIQGDKQFASVRVNLRTLASYYAPTTACRLSFSTPSVVASGFASSVEPTFLALVPRPGCQLHLPTISRR